MSHVTICHCHVTRVGGGAPAALWYGQVGSRQLCCLVSGGLRGTLWTAGDGTHSHQQGSSAGE